MREIRRRPTGPNNLRDLRLFGNWITGGGGVGRTWPGEVTRALEDKRQLDAEIVGTDPKTDIALLKIKADNLTALPLEELNWRFSIPMAD